MLSFIVCNISSFAIVIKFPVFNKQETMALNLTITFTQSNLGVCMSSTSYL